MGNGVRKGGEDKDKRTRIDRDNAWLEEDRPAECNY